MKREIPIAALALLLFVTGISHACVLPPCTPSPLAFALDTPEDDYEYPSSTTNVTLNWDTSINANGYFVYFGTSSPPLYHVSTSNTSQSVTVVSGQTYFWKILARRTGSCSPTVKWSNQTNWRFSVASDDTTPPEPDPMTWSVVPYASACGTISMTATTATDPCDVEYYFECTTGGGDDSIWQDESTYADTGLSDSNTCTYRVKARDKSPAQNETGWSDANSATTSDCTAPTPDPMTWATVPYASACGTISMTADTATDPSGFEYYFECTAGGGNDSIWQDESTYVDTGLSDSNTCTYRVKARDKSAAQNETGWSDANSATTPDCTAPTPDSMTWLVVPYATGSNSISMTATTATDPSGGIEYYFECTAGGGPNSVWQIGQTYSPNSLSDSTMYTYWVKAKDQYNNETDWSDPNSDTTFPAAPNNLTATAANTCSIDLTWSDNSPDETGFRIERKEDGDPNFSFLVNVDPNTESHQDTNGLSPSTTYYYQVRAERDSDYSLWSTEAWDTTCSLPGEPNNPYPESNSTDVYLDVILSWTPGTETADTNGHDIYFGIDFDDVNDANTSSYVYQGRQSPNSWDSNNYDPNGLTSDQIYYWSIAEVNDCGINKGPTWEFTTGSLPGKATNPSVKGPDGEPNTVDSILSWGPNSLALSHDIYIAIDFNDVNDANTSSASYMGNYEPNSFDTRRKFGFMFADTRLKNIGSLARSPDPNIIYVDDDVAGGNDGSNWADAYSDLQDALSDANTSGKDIWVAAGVYEPNSGSDRTATFQLISGVGLYGGFAGTEAVLEQRDWQINQTILSGDINSIGDNNDNSYHIVTATGTDANAVLDGFIITGGNANGPPTYHLGGGLFANVGGPTLKNCVFHRNNAIAAGGMFIAAVNKFEIVNCVFAENTSSSAGGGIINVGSSDRTFLNCVFRSNKSNGIAGGLYNSVAGTVTISKCLFYDNESAGMGGGLYNSGGSQIVTNCTFSNNISNGQYGGGGMFNTSCTSIVTNCTFIENFADPYGGAILNWSAASPKITNCIFWENEADTSGNQIYNNSGCDPNISYCNIQDSNGTGPNWDRSLGWDDYNNIDCDPLFVDSNDVDGPDGIFGTLDDGLFLTAESNSIDTGNPDTNDNDIGSVDITGYPRFVDGDSNGTELVDMGAYEYNLDPHILDEYERPPWTQSYAISKSGLIAGVSYDPNHKPHAFVGIASQGSDPYLWVSSLRNLHTEDPNLESIAYGITDSNWIVGSVDSNAFVLKDPNDPNMILLSSLFSEIEPNSVARAISNEGANSVAVGWSGGHAVYWDNLGSNDPNIHDLGTIDYGHLSKAYGINKYGQVVGYYYPIIGAEPKGRAFVGSVETTLTDIGTIEQGNFSRALHINNAGQVVGEATVDANDEQLRAFIYENCLMCNLNDLIETGPDDPNWTLISARGINDDGLIVGYGTIDDSNYTRAVLLIPMRPIGHWEFDESYGSTAMDVSIRGNHAQLFGPSWVRGKIRRALDFDGQDDYAITNDKPLDPQKADFTVAVWIKLDANDIQQTFVSQVDGDQWLGLSSEGKLSSTLGETTTTSTTVLETDKWYHVALVKSANKVDFYLDGILDGEPGQSIVRIDSTEGVLVFGSNSTQNNNFFKGLMDDLRIYPWAMSPKEANELFEGQEW